MKKLIARIWSSIKNVYSKITEKTRQWVPVAINVVEAVKTVTDGPVDDVVLAIVKKAIPGQADDVIIDKVHSTVVKWLPVVLMQLQMIDSIAKIENQNEQLIAIINRLKQASKETQAIVWHGLAALILEKLSDGKLSWSDSAAIAEYYYQNIQKQK